MIGKKKRWKLRDCDNEKAEQLAKGTGVHPVVAQILINRGIESPCAILDFLRSDLRHIHDPFLMKDMPVAVNRILSAVEKGEKILIFGDYDVDGITASAVMSDFLESCGGNIRIRLPNRLKDGYGLTKEIVEEAYREGTDLLITVDSGISSNKAAEYANDKGIDLIITDHHQPPVSLPSALAIINPRQTMCPYPYKDLAGVGVALKLVQAMFLSMQGKQVSINQTGCWPAALNRYLDIVCLGTIADVMPITGENRVLVKFGLDALDQTERPGIAALKEIAGIKGKNVSAGMVAFGLAPRINATGRICGPEEGLRLICTRSSKEAKELAQFLNLKNLTRRKIEEKIINEAQKKIEHGPKIDENMIIVLSDDGWHPGVIGIVAQRLVEEYYLPVVLISLNSGIGKGSARSIPQVHLYDLLCKCENLLEDFGGHAAAAGLTIAEEKITAFSEQANQILKNNFCIKDFVSSISIDAEMNGWPVDHKLIDGLNCLAPFGLGNPEPALCIKGLYLASRPLLLKNSHLKMSLKSGNFIYEAIGFNMKDEWETISSSPSDRMWDIVFYPQIDNWQGRSQIQLKLKGVRAYAEN
ncbi:single-stranded-DNA-specific exonuclease RecJ [bacterium]|nr:single-stranded-DNA-specific exonuclease RecJ [bacterium]